jgi:multidrug efflux system membrane fusion protein
MRSTDGQVEVLSGLKGGESLVIRGAEALQNGVTVRVAAPGAGQARAEKPDDTPAPPAKKG